MYFPQITWECDIFPAFASQSQSCAKLLLLILILVLAVQFGQFILGEWFLLRIRPSNHPLLIIV
jgi:hypothetical protein